METPNKVPKDEIRRPISQSELSGLRTAPLNISTDSDLRDILLVFVRCRNTLPVIAMLRMIPDCPRRRELLAEMRKRGIDVDRDFTWEDMLMVTNQPSY